MSKEILIVEDDRALARSLARSIEARGYLVRQAHDGNEALSEVSRALPDLILLDMLLPKKDGHAILADLGSSEATRQIPIVAMSGIFRGRNHAHEISRAGAAAFLEKPFPESELIAHIERLIGCGDVEDEQEGARESLENTTAAELIWRPMRDHLTGALHFQHEKRRKTLVFEDGEPRAVRSNLAKETLGRRLINAGRIDDNTYNQVRRRAKASGARQGGLLVDMGAITESQLGEAIDEQANQKLLELFSWREGEVWFQEGVRELSMSTELKHWKPLRLVLEGANNTHPVVLVTTLEPYVELRPEPIASVADGVRVQTAVDLLRSLDGGQTVGELMEEHAAALFGLWLIGALSFCDPNSGKVVSSNKPAAEDVAETLDQELRRRNDEQVCQNHFEVLGLRHDAPADEVRKAYVLLAKRFHPDKLTDGQEALVELATPVFARISQAHEVLTDPDSRRKYLNSMTKKSSGDGGEQRGSSVARIVSAEAQFSKAEELIKRREYAGAIEALDWAIELDPEEGDFHALKGWATFLSAPDDPQNKQAALVQMKRATSLAPNSPTGYYYQGQLHKACEDPAMAEKMFRKVLETRPGHVEAGREVRLIEMRRPSKSLKKAAEKKRARFGFGRKKK